MATQYEHGLFGGNIGPLGLVLWPSVLLAITGMARTWPYLATAALTLFVLSAICIRRKRFVVSPIAGIALPLLYVLCGAAAFRYLTAPLPLHTPYDTDAKKRQAYLETYDQGYRTGIAGTVRTYCFAPEHTTRGYYEGLNLGNEIFYRCLGIKRDPRIIYRSAAGDGVTLTPQERAR